MLIKQQRLKTNTDWESRTFALVAGDAPVDITGWTFSGAAVDTDGTTLPMTVANGRVVVVSADPGRIKLVLERTAIATLKPGLVKFELNRSAPAPSRPILSFSQELEVGSAA